MLLQILLLSFLATKVDSCTSSAFTTCITVKNQCSFPIYPGVQGSTLIANGGFKLNPGEARDLIVPTGWSAGRIWARTGCNENTWQCDTGFCGNSLECQGRGGVPPVSLAEFTMNGAGYQDFYDISLVDGYNLPLAIEVVPGTFKSTGDFYSCGTAGGCVKNLDAPSVCPPELRLINAAGQAVIRMERFVERSNQRESLNLPITFEALAQVVGCKSACLAFNTDQYCCRNAYGTPDKCKSSTWPVDYPKIFKDACPEAYSYAYDDQSSTFTCRGSNSPSPAYVVEFC